MNNNTMKMMKQQVNDIISKISNSVDDIKAKLKDQETIIESLKLENKKLKESNRKTLDQIKGYVSELEKIRNHYVNNNDSTSR